ncbi:2,3-bisphosphoglycerate-independent phosphoglycerate mutase [Candidatus Pacearchaeota archaeon]|nr:2,3-bisphosphoglycerate-independent phosphoglycerate mutase [Candidatus Pacearchaeota archaeon]
MKGVFVILDGIADEPCSSLGGKTPLQAAKTPHLDAIAKKASMGYCYSVKEGVAPESSSAVVSLLGYDPQLAARGTLEAQGAGIKLRPGDLALRCNFATIQDLDSGIILDRRAGRTLTTHEAQTLAKSINEQVKLPFPFEFRATMQHRGILIIKGGFSDNITNADPYYVNGMVNPHATDKMVYSKALDEEDDSKLSAELVNSFVRQSFEVLDKHPINLARARKGLFVANIIFCRDAGNSPIKFKKLKGKWMALAYMPLEAGIARAAGMEVFYFGYPVMKGMDVYAHLYDGLKKSILKAIKMLKKYGDKYDYFYIHLKETDIPGHDNKPHDKVKMIEMIDYWFFSFLKKFIGSTTLVVTGDHTTSCSKKAHTADPVPVLVYPAEKENNQRFTEEDGRNGRRMSASKLLENTLFTTK